MNNATEIVETARRVLKEFRSIQDGCDAAVVTLPGATIEEVTNAFAVAVQVGVLQVVPLTAENDDPQKFEHVVWREVARAGRSCQRIYVLPHSGFGGEMMKEFIRADSATNLKSRVAVVSRMPLDDQALSLRGMWILDENTVLLPSSHGFEARDGTGHYVVTSRAEDVRIAHESWDRLWSFARDYSAPKSLLDLEEPLAASADLLYGVAPVLCTGDHVDRAGCAWYHGTWQYLRLLQLVSTPTWHHEFYRNSFDRALAGRKNPEIAITGTADYSVLAYVSAAATQASVAPTITVIDLCATPLFACKWFAKRSGFTISTQQTDVREFFLSENVRYDIICTDAFLTRFNKAETSALLQGFRKVLKPGGRLITTIRVHTRSLVAREAEQLIGDFRERAIERAQRWEPFLHRTVDEIGSLAECYARKMQSFALGDEEEVLNSIRGSGLVAEHTELANVPGELVPTVYLRIVCMRPNE